MSDEIVITPYDPETDYDAVTDIWVRSGLRLYPPDTPERLARVAAHNPGLFLVARDGATVVGAVMGTTDYRALWIQHLAVDAAYRHRGLGARLMAEVEARGRALGLSGMLLLVYASNTEAIEFYEHQGWRDVPGVRFMVRAIDAPAADGGAGMPDDANRRTE